MSSVQVNRQVDTVVIEMDISVAERLYAVLNNVRDTTYGFPLDQDLYSMARKLRTTGGVRDTHKTIEADGFIHLKRKY